MRAYTGAAEAASPGLRRGRLSPIARACVRIDQSGFRRLRNDNLIGQKRMAIRQIEHGLMGQLLRVVGARATLEDDFLLRIDNVKVTDPTVGDTVDVTFDELGEF
jgi:hypothetical protein